jgi:hypothetical protein
LGAVDGAVACPPKRNSVAAPTWPQVIHRRFRHGFSPLSRYATAYGHTSLQPSRSGWEVIETVTKLAGMLDVSDIST